MGVLATWTKGKVGGGGVESLGWLLPPPRPSPRAWSTLVPVTRNQELCLATCKQDGGPCFRVALQLKKKKEKKNTFM